MRFSTIAVLSFVASTAAFVPVANRAHVIAPFATRQSNTPLFSLADLESKLMNPEPPKVAASVSASASAPVEKTKPTPKPAPVRAPRAEKPAPTPKVVKASPAPVPAPAPVPVVVEPPKPVPVVATKGKSSTKKSVYDLDTGIPEPPKKVAPSVIKFEKAKPLTKVERSNAPPKAPKAPVAPKAQVEQEANAALGVLVGGAPLILAPLAALVAGRDVLTKTAARREVIQKEIAAFEAAQAKKKFQTNVDGGGIAKAAVRHEQESDINRPLLCVCYCSYI